MHHRDGLRVVLVGRDERFYSEVFSVRVCFVCDDSFRSNKDGGLGAGGRIENTHRILEKRSGIRIGGGLRVCRNQTVGGRDELPVLNRIRGFRITIDDSIAQGDPRIVGSDGISGLL